MILTESILRQIAPTASKEAVRKFVGPLNDTMAKYEINTPARQSAFLAQILHESGALRFVREIASGVKYEGRKDLGNTIPGDGVKFKGRGLIQITGKNNYIACSIDLFGNRQRLLMKPELLELPEYAAMSAGWFWKGIKGNALADLPGTWRSATKHYTPFQYITYRINGGQNGADERQSYYERAKRALV